MTLTDKLVELWAYKVWADDLTYDAVETLPAGEADKVRTTRWESISYTMSHALVVEDIFRHHLTGRRHGYTMRNTPERRSVATLRGQQDEMNLWYRDVIARMTAQDCDDMVRFQFVGGGDGAMTRGDIILHLVNHATYHRGLISDMMCQIPAEMPANDYPVFIRDRVLTVA